MPNVYSVASFLVIPIFHDKHTACKVIPFVIRLKKGVGRSLRTYCVTNYFFIIMSTLTNVGSPAVTNDRI